MQGRIQSLIWKGEIRNDFMNRDLKKKKQKKQLPLKAAKECFFNPLSLVYTSVQVASESVPSDQVVRLNV